MKIFILLSIITFISLHIPHNSRKYNFSWYTRLLFTITLVYGVSNSIYYLIT